MTPPEPIRLGKLEITSLEFFRTPLNKLRVECDPIINRTYLLKGEHIVAVGRNKDAVS